MTIEEFSRIQILEFLRIHIPMVVDPIKQDLVYDKTSMYYKTREYILDLEKRGDK